MVEAVPDRCSRRSRQCPSSEPYEQLQDSVDDFFISPGFGFSFRRWALVLIWIRKILSVHLLSSNFHCPCSSSLEALALLATFESITLLYRYSLALSAPCLTNRDPISRRMCF
jgi:hypothetical protein